MCLLVIGATGNLGRQIVIKALEYGFQVKCLVRNRNKANFLVELGAEIVYGDLTIIETLPLCFNGVTAIIDAATTRLDDIANLKEIDWTSKLALIRIAKICNIKRFIFFSIVNAENYASIPLMEMKFKIEKNLKNSGVPFTIFKLAGFYQAFISQYAIPVLDKQTIWITNESLPISYIDTQDAASICLNSLFIRKTQNETFFLGNPKSWFSKSIVEICEKLSGQKAKLNIINIRILILLYGITSLFEWTSKINERLAFVKLLEKKQIQYSNIRNLDEAFDMDKINFVKLENYLEEYFQIILKTLKDLNYEKTSKQRDLTI
jgi:uncharacterized protein YbjT (DUF2867 family)